MRTLWVLFQLIYITLIKLHCSESNNKGLISGGVIYDHNDYPFLVGIEVTKAWYGIATCTGTLISPYYVLTAGHCTFGNKAYEIKVYLGTLWEDNPNYQYVERIYQHKNYQINSLTADISILKLWHPFKNVNRYVVLAGHPSEFKNGTELNCTIVGFGMINAKKQLGYDGFMTTVNVTLGPGACQEPTKEVVQTEWEFLCSKPSVQAICPGDSGGPLMCNGFQYGVASHAYSLSRRSTVECGRTDIQTRHLFVYGYMDWIRSVRNAGKPTLVFRHRNAAAVVVVTCGALYSATRAR